MKKIGQKMTSKARNNFLKVAALSAALSVGACTGVEPAVMFLAAASTITLTDKLPTDHITSGITGEDCNSIRQQEDGGPLCRSADYGKVVEKPVYCYRSLGSVNCYDEPDPYKTGAVPVQ